MDDVWYLHRAAGGDRGRSSGRSDIQDANELAELLDRRAMRADRNLRQGAQRQIEWTDEF